MENSPFILTNFIYPLDKSLTLSEDLDYVLDNPRTDDEIDYIVTLLLNDCDAYLLKISDKIQSQSYIKQLEQSFYLWNKFYYKQNLNFKNETGDLKTTLAKIGKLWVILRINVKKHEQYDQKSELENTIDTTSYTHRTLVPAIAKAQEYFEFTALLCLYFNLKTHTKPHYELFRTNSRMFFKNISANLVGTRNEISLDTLFLWMEGSNIIEGDTVPIHLDFELFIKNLNSFKPKLKQILQTKDRELILYICELLHNIRNTDYKIQFISMVSVIEMLLTHNPDYNRFNVEESISKQFKLKLSILIHDYSKDTDLKKLNEDLKEIYNIRCDIAHGNFSKLKRNDKLIREYLENLYYYIFIVINRFLDEPEYITYLKEN